MISLCIKSNNKKVTDYFINNLNKTNLEGIYYSIIKFSKFNNFIIHYKDKYYSNFYNNIADLITDLILEIYEPKIIREILFSDYFYFDNLDMNEIYQNCIYTLNNSEEFKNRKQILWTLVLKHITNSKSIYLYGFITFRIKDYLKIINNAIDSSVNKYVINKEYSNFIYLVQTYLSNNISNTDIIHLIYFNNEKSILLDENKNIINPINNNLSYLSDISFSSNDYILNTILSIIPNRIIVHLNSEEDEFINTLKLIFGDNISICYNCNICNSYKNKLTTV